MSKLGPPSKTDVEGIIEVGIAINDVVTWAKEGSLDLFGWLERRWYVDHDLDALYIAVWYCFFRNEPLPDWASLGVIEIMFDASQRRGDGSQQREERHRRRWAKVEELKKLSKEEFKRQFGEKKNLPNVWRIAAEQLTAEGEPTSDEAVRKSCQEVARLFKAMNRCCLDEVGPKTSPKFGP